MKAARHDSGAQMSSYEPGGGGMGGTNGPSTGMGCEFPARGDSGAAMTEKAASKMAARALSEDQIPLGRLRRVCARRGDDRHPFVGQPLSRRVRVLLVFLQSAACGFGSPRRRALHDPIELTNGNSDPCAQKDQNGVLYTAEAANIATTAQPAAGGAARVNGWKAADVTISCLSSAALDNGRYADGSTSMTIIDVATSFTDPSLGLFSILGLKAPLLSFSHQERFLGPG